MPQTAPPRRHAGFSGRSQCSGLRQPVHTLCRMHARYRLAREKPKNSGQSSRPWTSLHHDTLHLLPGTTSGGRTASAAATAACGRPAGGAPALVARPTRLSGGSGLVSTRLVSSHPSSIHRKNSAGASAGGRRRRLTSHALLHSSSSLPRQMLKLSVEAHRPFTP